VIGSTGLIEGTSFEQHKACLSCSCGGFHPYRPLTPTLYGRRLLTLCVTA
jgi:hypothetical protein